MLLLVTIINTIEKHFYLYIFIVFYDIILNLKIYLM